MAKYVSGRQKNLKVGISSYSENLTSIQVIGNVGIGTTNATSKLYVVGDGYFTGVVTATNINVSSSSSFSQLYVSGITTLAANGGITTTGGDLYVGGDLYIADDLRFDEFNARNGNITGVATIATLNNTVGTITNLGGTNVNYTGVGTIATLNSTVATLTNLGGTNLNFSGLSTATTLRGNNLNYTGVGTIARLNSTVATLTNLGGTNINYTGVGTITTLGSTNGTITNLGGTNLNYTGVGTIATLNSTVATLTNLGGTNINYTGVGTIATLNNTVGTITNLGGTNINYTGVGTIATLNNTVGTITNLGGTNVNYTGVGTIATLNSTVATLTNLGGTNINYTGVGTITTLGSTNGTITNLSGTIGTITTLNSTNSTLTNINSSGITTLTRLGVNGLTTTSQLVVSGVSTLGVVTASQLFVSGVATATTFIGALTGIAASATQLVTPRTFQITGDIVASPIFFDGTGNVSLAATIQPNSVGLGTDTTGDYVQAISGTANQITVTSGTGEGSTPTLSIPNQFTIPQDATVTRDLQINRNLTVTGNVTIGGTSATIFSQSLNIFDPDIILGFRTDGSGNDISNDNTANHGGIAIASTEGTPLVQLFIAGIETNPTTYKKIMWFKAGTFAGLGTDAWLSNYAIGIGSTQFPAGTRLAAGAVQFTENDLSVIRNINASGIITATTGSITTINGTTANYSTGNIVTGVITNAQGTNLNYSGIGTITNLVGTNINYSGVGTITTFNATTSTITNGNGTNLNFSGLSTATTLRGNNLNYSGVGTIATFNATTSTITNGNGTNLNFSGIGTITTLNSTVGTITNLGGTNVNYTGVGTIATLNSTVATLTNLGGTNVNYSGVGTIATLNSTVATLTNLGGTNVNYSGVGTIATFNATTSTITNENGTNLNFSGLSTATTLRGTNINYSGVGTITTFNATTSTITNENGTNLNFSGVGTVGSLNIGATQVISSARQLQNIASLDATTTATIESAITNAPNTFTDLQVTGISTFTNGPVFIGSGTSTGTASQLLQVTGGAYVSGNIGVGTTNPSEAITVLGKVQILQNSGSNNRIILRGQPGSLFRWNIDNNGSTNDFRIFREDDATASNGVVYLGISTSGTVSATIFSGQVNANVGIVTNVVGTNLNYSGIATVGSLNIGATQVISSARQLQNIASLDATTTATIESAIANAPNTFTDLQVTGISTFTNGPVFIGSGTSTGTVSQRLQVTGGSYFSGSVGIGTTTPSSTLHIAGDALIVGVSTANSFRARGGAPGAIGTNNNGYGFFGSGDNDSGMYSSADGQIEFYSNSTEAARITSNRNLLIGTTSETGTASQRLQVTGGAYVSGNLGVGITTPGSPLVVNGTSRFFTSGQGDVVIIHSSLISSILGATTVQLALGANNTEAIRINTSNNVGINSTTPTSRLDVVGDAKVSGVATVDQLYTSNNGNSQNVRIGDDAWIGDLNVANTLRISGVQNSQNGFVVFGNQDSVALGRTGTGPLYYGGNFVVAGIITTANLNVSGITTSPTYDTASTRVGSATSTTTSITQTAIHTGLSTSLYRSVEYMVQGTQGTNYHSTKILVVHDGVTAYLTEYGTVYNAATVASYDVDISGGNLRLLATPSSASSTTFKVSFTSIVV